MPALNIALAMTMLVVSAGGLAGQGGGKPVQGLTLIGESLLVEGRPAFVLLPPKEKRTTPQPWILYAPTLPGLPDRHEQWMHKHFLEAGIAVAGIDVGEAHGSPKGRELFTALYKELAGRRGFAPRWLAQPARIEAWPEARWRACAG